MKKTMHKEFIPYKESNILKELGFDEKCMALYLNQHSNNEGYLKELENTVCNEHEAFGPNGEDAVAFVTYNNTKVYKQYTTAPTYRQALEWFRTKYDMCASATFNRGEDKMRFDYLIDCADRYYLVGLRLTYEKAELAAIRKLIELAKEKQK